MFAVMAKRNVFVFFGSKSQEGESARVWFVLTDRMATPTRTGKFVHAVTVVAKWRDQFLGTFTYLVSLPSFVVRPRCPYFSAALRKQSNIIVFEQGPKQRYCKAEGASTHTPHHLKQTTSSKPPQAYYVYSRPCGVVQQCFVAPNRPPLPRVCPRSHPAPAVVRNKVKYMQFKKKRHNTNPKRGPYHFRSPARIFWRTVSPATTVHCTYPRVALTESLLSVSAPRPVSDAHSLVKGEALVTYVG